MRARNVAILAKLCWRIASSLEAPWALMLTSKYLTLARLGERGRRLPALSTWVACKDGGVIFNKGLKWSISNGEAMSAWDDFWLASCPLRKLIQGPLLEGEGKNQLKSSLQMRLTLPLFSLNQSLRKYKEYRLLPIPSKMIFLFGPSLRMEASIFNRLTFLLRV